MRQALQSSRRSGLRRGLCCILLALMLVLTTGLAQPAVFGAGPAAASSSTASSMPSSTPSAAPQTFYKLVTGVIFLWGPRDSTAGWDPAAPGGTYTVNTSDQLPKGSANVKIFWYVPEQFDLDKMPNVEGPQDTEVYQQQYKCYGVKGQSTALKQGPDPSGRIAYSYTFQLEAEKEFPVERSLSSANGISEIRGLIGNYIGSLDKYLHQQKIGQNVSCRMFFLPYLIQYDWAPEDDGQEKPEPFPMPDDGRERSFSLAANLTGTQKQNRLQVLNLRVDLPQGRNLSELKVALEDPMAKETARLDWKGAGGGLDNTTQIKTRQLTLLAGKPSGSTARSVDYKLEFLTKNSQQQEFKFTALAVDDRGQQTEAVGQFTVEPDQPPQAKIGLEGSYLRAPNSNRAEIQAEDVSRSDGDQLQRTWTVSLTSGAAFDPPVLLRDRSFGTGKHIGFAKEGVGPFRVRLAVRDVWIEETLPEYVTEADYLSDTAEAGAQVINTAPVVQLGDKVKKTASGNLLLLWENEAQRQGLAQARNDLQAGLLERGIESRIQMEAVDFGSQAPAGEDPALPWVSAKFTEPYGHLGEQTFLEKDGFLVDEKNLYTVQASWAGAGAGDQPQYPYVIRSRNGTDGRVQWSCPISANQLAVRPKAGESSLCQDDSGTFLFFRSGEKTLVLTKDNGSIQAVLPIWLGDSNFVENDRIYTLRKDGIYTVKLETGAIDKIEPAGSVGMARRVGDRVHFAARKENGRQCSRGVLDLVSGSVTLQPLPGLSAVEQVQTLGVDSDGKLILSVHSTGKQEVRVYDSSNHLIKTIPADRTTANRMTVTPMYDQSGQCTDLAATWQEQDNRGGYHNHAQLYGIYDGFSAGTEVKSARAFQTASDRILLARKIGTQGYLITGGDWGRKPGTNELRQEYGSLEKAQGYRFDFKNGTAALMDIADLGGDISYEYGSVSDTLAVLHSADNTLGNTVEQGSKYRILSWVNDADSTLFRQVRKHGNQRADTGWIAGPQSFLKAALVPGGMAGKLLNAFDLKQIGIEKTAFVSESAADGKQAGLAETLMKKLVGTGKGAAAGAAGTVRFYERGQPVAYGPVYSDREGDPSKAQFWRYTHTPGKDGLHPESGKILHASIPSFQQDGTYTVEHWQQDRTGNETYDRTSQIASMTFAVGNANHLPKVTAVGTAPAQIKGGSWYQVEAGVWDQDGDELTLLTEVYQGEQKIFSHVKTALRPDAKGNYPKVVTGTVPLPAAPGVFRVVCTAKDQSGSGKGTYEFTVTSETHLNGWVNHTQQWEENRKKYNLKRFKEEINHSVSFDSYRKTAPPRKRGTNVFWSGEEFQLRAELSGKPKSVNCVISGTNYSVPMYASGKQTESGDRIYSGTLWQESMINHWGRKAPELLNFHFKANYTINKKTVTITKDVPVIVDSKEDFWQLRRLW